MPSGGAEDAPMGSLQRSDKVATLKILGPVEGPLGEGSRPMAVSSVFVRVAGGLHVLTFS